MRIILAVKAGCARRSPAVALVVGTISVVDLRPHGLA
jgi:hypothetical protein